MILTPGQAQTLPRITAADAGIFEGNSGSTNLIFRLSLSEPCKETVTVDYATRDVTAKAGPDYAPAFGVAVFSPGNTNVEVLVSVNGNTLNEADKTFWLMLTNAVHGKLTKPWAVGTILNDDAIPMLSISDAVIALDESKNKTALFTVNASAPGGQIITVDYEALGGTAAPGTQFVPSADTLTFLPGVTRQVVSVPVFEEAAGESAAVLYVALSDPMHATIARSRGVATIFPAGPSQIAKIQPSALLTTNKMAGQLGPKEPNSDLHPSREKELARSAQEDTSAKSFQALAASGTNVLLEMNVGEKAVHVEKEVAVTLTITNYGDTAAQGIVVTNWLPATATFRSAQISQGTFLQHKDHVVFRLGLINGGTNATAVVHFKLSAPGLATNIARIDFAGAATGSPDHIKSQVMVAINDPPVVSLPGPQFTVQNTPTPPLAFTINDNETPATDLIVLGSSSDPSLVPAENLIFGGIDSNRTVTIIPAPNQAGSAAITIIAIDPDGGESSANFDLTISSIEAVSIERSEGIPAPYFQWIEHQAGRTKFLFKAEAGVAHRIEFNDSLSSEGWQMLTNVSALPVTTMVEVSDETAQSPQRFYRLNAFAAGPGNGAATQNFSRILLHFDSKPGKAYTIEYCDSLESTAWQVLTRISPLPEPYTITVSDTDPAAPSRFYRVRSP